MPKISIITTTYKHQDFIAHTIKSVLSQTYIDRELLIGDDSPDDTTWEIIQEYVHKYPDKIKARHHKPNKGIVDNMNFLIDQADSQSEYISFLEWDDMYTSDNLQEKMKVFEQYPDVSLVYSDLQTINKNWDYINHVITQNVIRSDIDNIYHFSIDPNNVFSRSNCIVKKNILKNIKPRNVTWNKSYSVSDWDFYVNVLSKYKYKIIWQKLFYYRIHTNNISFQENSIAKDIHSLISFYFKSDIRKINKLVWYAIKNYNQIRLSWFVKVIITFFLWWKNINKMIEIRYNHYNA